MLSDGCNCVFFFKFLAEIKMLGKMLNFFIMYNYFYKLYHFVKC